MQIDIPDYQLNKIKEFLLHRHSGDKYLHEQNGLLIAIDRAEAQQKNPLPTGTMQANGAKDVVETVNHPPHYGGDTTYEAIKVIESWRAGFNLGCALKYIRRSLFQGRPVFKVPEDLKKAAWYLNRELSHHTGENTEDLANRVQQLTEQIDTLGKFIISLDCGLPVCNDQFPNGMGAVEAAIEYIKILRDKATHV